MARHLASLLRPGGLLVTGTGLDAAHFPLPEPPPAPADSDRWRTEAGLTLRRRCATWDGAPYEPVCGHAVSVHSRVS